MYWGFMPVTESKQAIFRCVSICSPVLKSCAQMMFSQRSVPRRAGVVGVGAIYRRDAERHCLLGARETGGGGSPHRIGRGECKCGASECVNLSFIRQQETWSRGGSWMMFKNYCSLLLGDYGRCSHLCCRDLAPDSVQSVSVWSVS